MKASFTAIQGLRCYQLGNCYAKFRMKPQQHTLHRSFRTIGVCRAASTR